MCFFQVNEINEENLFTSSHVLFDQKGINWEEKWDHLALLKSVMNHTPGVGRKDPIYEQQIQ